MAVIPVPPAGYADYTLKVKDKPSAETAIENLPMQFSDKKNISSLVAACVEGLDEISVDIELYQDISSLETAIEDRLDQIGKMVGCPRAGEAEEDEAYRLRVFMQILVNRCDGTLERVVEILNVWNVEFDPGYPKVSVRPLFPSGTQSHFPCLELAEWYDPVPYGNSTKKARGQRFVNDLTAAGGHNESIVGGTPVPPKIEYLLQEDTGYIKQEVVEGDLLIDHAVELTAEFETDSIDERTGFSSIEQDSSSTYGGIATCFYNTSLSSQFDGLIKTSDSGALAYSNYYKGNPAVDENYVPGRLFVSSSASVEYDYVHEITVTSDVDVAIISSESGAEYSISVEILDVRGNVSVYNPDGLRITSTGRQSLSAVIYSEEAIHSVDIYISANRPCDFHVDNVNITTDSETSFINIANSDFVAGTVTDCVGWERYNNEANCLRRSPDANGNWSLRIKKSEDSTSHWKTSQSAEVVQESGDRVVYNTIPYAYTSVGVNHLLSNETNEVLAQPTGSTLSFWFNIPKYNVLDTTPIYSTGTLDGSGNPTQKGGVSVRPTTNKSVECVLNLDGTTLVTLDATSVEILQDTWHHVALVGEDDRNFKVYVDGVCHSTYASVPLEVGGVAKAKVGGRTTDTQFSNIGYWSRGLRAEEVAYVASGPTYRRFPSSLTSTIVSYYHLDQLYGEDDVYFQGLELEVEGKFSLVPIGPILKYSKFTIPIKELANSSWKLNQTPYNAQVSAVAVEGFTAGGWFKPDLALSQKQVLMSAHNSAVTQSVSVGVDELGNVVVTCTNGLSSDTQVTTGVVTVESKEWNQIAISSYISGSSLIVTAIVNGAEEYLTFSLTYAGMSLTELVLGGADATLLPVTYTNYIGELCDVGLRGGRVYPAEIDYILEGNRWQNFPSEIQDEFIAYWQLKQTSGDFDETENNYHLTIAFGTSTHGERRGHWGPDTTLAGINFPEIPEADISAGRIARVRSFGGSLEVTPSSAPVLATDITVTEDTMLFTPSSALDITSLDVELASSKYITIAYKVKLEDTLSDKVHFSHTDSVGTVKPFLESDEHKLSAIVRGSVYEADGVFLADNYSVIIAVVPVGANGAGDRANGKYSLYAENSGDYVISEVTGSEGKDAWHKVTLGGIGFTATVTQVSLYDRALNYGERKALYGYMKSH